ncbi:MAG: hypothetical protein JKY15_01140 [Deltaproteobacteria bacterium]|nr:hypothetical protein [Deltaproteobacteria bacterium]
MITTFLTLTLFAFLCLFLESLGSKIGKRKSGERTYILAIALAGLLISSFPLFGAAQLAHLKLSFVACSISTLLALFLANAQLRQAQIEYGEVYALILVCHALTLYLITSQDLLQFILLSAFANMLLVGLSSFRKDHSLVTEVALKYLIISIFLFCLLSLSLLFFAHSNQVVARSFLWGSLLLFIGCTPFFNIHVKYLEKAPPFASTLLMSVTLIGGGSFIANFATQYLSTNLFHFLLVFASLSLIIPPILALDQQRIAKLVSFLCMVQAGILLLLSLFKLASIQVFFLHLSLAIPGTLAGIRFWKHSQKSGFNWEDYAGAGRKHPLVALAWLYTLSSLIGAPLTLGFWLYLEIAQAAIANQLEWILALIGIAIVLGMFPIARLAVFMFGKPTRHAMMRLHRPQQSFLIIACAGIILGAKIICFWLPQYDAVSVFNLWPFTF